MSLEQLGPYRLVRRLGRGGMGAVFEGVNVETNESAAVKVLSNHLSHEHDFRERFAAEIETLRRLNHPNIVRLFGFGQQQDQLYYAMEIVDGVSLEEEIQRGRVFTWREVIHIGNQMCLALRHAHDRGVIHRDIKPANLLWARDGTVKLSDFGIARLFGNDGLTAVGSVIGTVEYMAPEQADGRTVGPQADLYSLGGVLYALLAGRPPLVAKTLPEMLHKQRYERPEMLTDAADDVPEDLANLIDQLLEKDPADRVRNAMLLGRRLEAIRLGLARKEAVERLKVEGQFQLAPPSGQVDESDPASLAETRVLDEDEPAGPVPMPTPAEDLPMTRATDFFDAAPSPAADAAPTARSDSSVPADETAPDDRFTPVAEHELDRAPEPDEPRPALISAQTWVLAAAILAIGLTTLYLLRPRSADSLYARITAKVKVGEPLSYFLTRDDVAKFLSNYPEDPRCRTLRQYEEEIQLYQLENKFNRRTRNLNENDERLLPVEMAYIDACSCLSRNLQLGMKKLQALIDLYGSSESDSGPTAQCLELARRKLIKLKAAFKRDCDDQQMMIQARLDRADAIRRTEPERARKMYEAMVLLYDDKPWAVDLVRRARESLKSLDK